MVAGWIVLLSLVLHLDRSEGVYKKWLPDTNYNNPKNWDSATVPCENDVIHFSDGHGNAPVFIQSNISTRSLVLPVNGELVLEDNVMIAFPTEHSNKADCPGKDVHFVGSVAHSWLEPDNWCEAASPGFACLTNQPPRLDTERVPCQHDNIIIPKHGTLNVDLEGVDVSVGSLSIAEQPEPYLDTIKQWSATGSVTVQPRTCDDDPAGCPCGNDHGQVEAAICAHQSSRCPPTPCLQPLKVQGHCCHICGGKMELDYAADFRFSTLYNALKYQYGQAPNSESATFVMTLSSAGHVLVVVWDDQGGHAAENIARSLALFIKQDKDGSQKYRITEVKFYSSAGDGPSTGALTGGSGGSSLSTGSIAGIILSIGLLLVIVIICIICFVDRSQCRRFNNMIPIRFKRKDDEEQLNGSMELAAAASSNIKDVSFRSHPSTDHQAMPQGFDNPMYGSPVAVNEREQSGLDANANAPPTSEIDLSDVAPEDVTFTTDKTMAGNTAFDNPLYGTAKKQVLDEKNGEGSKDEGFSNPMYQENGKSDLVYQGSILKLNPVYSDEGVEDESNI